MQPGDSLTLQFTLPASRVVTAGLVLSVCVFERLNRSGCVFVGRVSGWRGREGSDVVTFLKQRLPGYIVVVSIVSVVFFFFMFIMMFFCFVTYEI